MGTRQAEETAAFPLITRSVMNTLGSYPSVAAQYFTRQRTLKSQSIDQSNATAAIT